MAEGRTRGRSRILLEPDPPRLLSIARRCSSGQATYTIMAWWACGRRLCDQAGRLAVADASEHPFMR